MDSHLEVPVEENLLVNLMEDNQVELLKVGILVQNSKIDRLEDLLKGYIREACLMEDILTVAIMDSLMVGIDLEDLMEAYLEGTILEVVRNPMRILEVPNLVGVHLEDKVMVDLMEEHILKNIIEVGLVQEDMQVVPVLEDTREALSLEDTWVVNPNITLDYLDIAPSFDNFYFQGYF